MNQPGEYLSAADMKRLEIEAIAYAAPAHPEVSRVSPRLSEAAVEWAMTPKVAEVPRSQTREEIDPKAIVEYVLRVGSLVEQYRQEGVGQISRESVAELAKPDNVTLAA